MAKLYFRYGTMGASKTASALMLKYNYEERGHKPLLVKPAVDTRDGKNMLKSRCGLNSSCMLFENLDDNIVKEHDAIIVDEAQFLNRRDIEFIVHIVDDLNIPVICYGLRTDFKSDPFEGSKYLLAWADKIEEIKTMCDCGGKATFNHKYDMTNQNQIEISGSDKYVGKCRQCFNDKLREFNRNLTTKV